MEPVRNIIEVDGPLAKRFAFAHQLQTILHTTKSKFLARHWSHSTLHSPNLPATSEIHSHTQWDFAQRSLASSGSSIEWVRKPFSFRRVERWAAASFVFRDFIEWKVSQNFRKSIAKCVRLGNLCRFDVLHWKKRRKWCKSGENKVWILFSSACWCSSSGRGSSFFALRPDSWMQRKWVNERGMAWFLFSDEKRRVPLCSRTGRRWVFVCGCVSTSNGEIFSFVWDETRIVGEWYSSKHTHRNSAVQKIFFIHWITSGEWEKRRCLVILPLERSGRYFGVSIFNLFVFKTVYAVLSDEWINDWRL